MISLYVDLSGAAAHVVGIIPCRHAQQRFRIKLKRFFDAQRHFRRSGGLAVSLEPAPPVEAASVPDLCGFTTMRTERTKRGGWPSVNASLSADWTEPPVML
jgi:hypothetical protein